MRSTLRQHFVHLLRPRTYDDFYALRDINLTVERGEFLGVIGKNGSGKSTLLKLIANVLLPTSGSVQVEGRVAPFLELGVGFQGELTVRDNIYLYGAILGLHYREIRTRYDWIIDFAALASFEDTKLKNLSSGMQVRLGFSITVSVDCPILLVDEVLAVGDIDFQQKCYTMFESFKQQGKTVFFVSHDLQAVRSFCDRVLVLDRGVVVQAGEPNRMVQWYQERSHHEAGPCL